MRGDALRSVIILILSAVALGFVYFVNTRGTLDYLANTLEGNGMGSLCSSPDDCRKFCQNSMGRCHVYCQDNPANRLCQTIFKNK